MRDAGCDRIIVEIAPQQRTAPNWRNSIAPFAPADTIAVWRLDRLGRSLRDLNAQVDAIQAVGVGLRSLRQTIDTSSAGGRLVLHVFAAIAAFERDLIHEQQTLGLPPLAREAELAVGMRASRRPARRRPAMGAGMTKIFVVLALNGDYHRHCKEMRWPTGSRESARLSANASTSGGWSTT